MIFRKNFIVNMNKSAAGTFYRVIVCKYDDVTHRWKLGKADLDENRLKAALAKGSVTLSNAELTDKGTIKGTTGSLSRFASAGSVHPFVIISEVYAKANNTRLIGFRVGKSDGSVVFLKKDNMYHYCAQVNDVAKHNNIKIVPIQNAMYVEANEENGTHEHIRGYVDDQFIKEYVTIRKSNKATGNKVNMQENNKKISKLEEMFTTEQIEQLKLGKIHGVDIRYYGNNKLSPEQMAEIRKALESHVNPRYFADPAFSAEAMKAYRIQSKYGIDIRLFVNPEFTVPQINELSVAYLNGVDVSKIADPKLPVIEMTRERIRLETEMWKEPPVSIIDSFDTDSFI